MFTLVDTYLFWYPVQIAVPDAKIPGKFVKQSFDVQFEAIDRDEAQRITDEVLALTGPARDEREDDLLFRAIKDWKGVIDPDREPIEFTDEALRRAMRYSWFRKGIYDAFNKAMSGEARRGN